MNKLMELKLVDVIFTSDGKEYVTQMHLAKEILNELTVHGGRVNFVDLQQSLNVDLSILETVVAEMVKRNNNYTLILGQLIDRSYLERLAVELNDCLQHQGHITIAEMSKKYDLPLDIVRDTVHSLLGSVILGEMDNNNGDVIFTSNFVRRMRAQIRGAFTAVTMPTTVGSIRTKIGCQELLFHSLLHELVKSERISGYTLGGRQDSSVFYPSTYTRAQQKWMDDFYTQNGYLEFDSLTRLGFPDPKATVIRQMRGWSDVVMLSSCCVGHNIVDQLSASIEDALHSKTWVDAKSILPSSFSGRDVDDLLQHVLPRHTDAVVCGDGIVASCCLVDDSSQYFTDLFQRKVEAAHQALTARRKAAELRHRPALKASEIVKQEGDGKGDYMDQQGRNAAGGQRRSLPPGGEPKCKLAKRKGTHRRIAEESNSVDEPIQSVMDECWDDGGKGNFMELQDIQDVLKAQAALRDCPTELLIHIAQQLYRPLNRQYREATKSIFLQTSCDAGVNGRRKAFDELSARLSILWTNICLFEKGVKLFEESLHSSLYKHLLRTLCSDMTNIVVSFVANDHMISIEDVEMTSEWRQKAIAALPKEVQLPLIRIHKDLCAQNVSEFSGHMADFCASRHMGVILRKPDRRRERQVMFEHLKHLGEQLKMEEKPPLVLHLSVTILALNLSQRMIHIPGRLVPIVMSHLESVMDSSKYMVLKTFQELVMQQVSAVRSLDEERGGCIAQQLSGMMPSVKDIAMTTRQAKMQTAQ